MPGSLWSALDKQIEENAAKGKDKAPALLQGQEQGRDLPGLTNDGGKGNGNGRERGRER